MENKSKLLGIDYGSKRIGLAVSNEDRTMAFPKAVLQNDGQAVSYIKELCQKEEIGRIIMGESQNFKGEDNLIMKQINMFKEVLERETGLPVYLEPEFMTSAEAERLQGRNSMLDASAAALILKSFLDKKRNIS